MTSTLVKRLWTSMETLKLVKSSISEDEVRKFINTCDAAANLDEYEDVLKGYPLTSYKLTSTLSAVVWPRKVKLMLTYGMDDLRIEEDVEDDIYSPSEFVEFQMRVYNLFKKVPSFEMNLEEASKPMLLSDVLDCVEIDGGILCQGSPSKRPVCLNFEFCKESGIGEIECDEFYREFTHSIINKIRK